MSVKIIDAPYSSSLETGCYARVRTRKLASPVGDGGRLTGCWPKRSAQSYGNAVLVGNSALPD